MIAQDEIEGEEEIINLSSLNNEKKPDLIEKKQSSVVNKVQQQQSQKTTQALTQGTVKFMSKKEREQLKKQQEEQEKKEEKQKQKEIDRVREEYEKFRYKDWKRKQEKEERRRQRKEEEERRRKRLEQSRSRSRSPSQDDDLEENVTYVTSNSRSRIPMKLEQIAGDKMDKESMAIKMQYLGIKAEKKRLLKPSEKFKNIFNFSWDKSDDTSVDYNPIYKKRLQQNLLFGRGVKAGFDVNEQKAQSVNYEQLIHKDDPNYISKQDNMTLYQEDRKNKRDMYDLGEGDHWSKKQTKNMTERDWRIFREDNNIVIKGGRVPKPMRQWDEIELPQFVHDAIQRLKYKEPTPIQMQAIPIGMERKDMIGIAPTGSGKSLAYLIPMVSYLKNLPPIEYEDASLGPYGLILLPTRELAPQVEQEFENLTKCLKIRSLVVVGGRSHEEQQFQLQKGVELIIGTPGRIMDALKNKYLVFEQCSWVVLDEADKMIDMGFETEVNYILSSIKSQLKAEDENIAQLQERQSKTGQSTFRVTHLFSATFPDKVEKIAKQYMRSLCYIQIGDVEGGKKDIDQRVEFIGEHGKKQRLQQVLQSFEPPIIIFANEKKGVELLAKIIERWGYRSVVYHGSKTQQQREAAVDGFKNKQYDVLIATDLAGRGLHVEGVTLVINFDAPKTIADFIHRTGRTGRAGKKGVALTFLTAHDEQIFYDLNEFLLKNNYHVPPELANHEATRTKPGTVGEYKPRNKQILFAQ